MKPLYSSVFIFLFFTLFTLHAQENNESENNAYSSESKIGLSLNAFNYLGDINENLYPYLPETNLGASIFFRRDFNKDLGLKLDISAGSISGSDNNFDTRTNFSPNLTFSSFFVSSSASLEWFPLGKEKVVKRQVMDDFSGEVAYLEYISEKKSWVPFFGLGLGAIYFDPQITSPDVEWDYDFSNIGMFVPVSAGVYYTINNSLSLGIEASLLVSFTDRLDGIDRLKGTNDWVTSLSLTMAYHLR